ncbi:MAG TPA: Gfo/Idh/MocA family oxidoreductase [Puia sp.]|jgi:predicted dehydrogenase|nr:Gfo/Idh/MocA family oxidoreductase [Puia sp.]
MLKVGVLGAGNLGEIHLNTWKEVDQIQIAGFYESSDSVAAYAKDTFAVNRFSNVDHLIDASDLIDITTPENDCFEWCEKAIRKGKHVFIEKTLANSVEEAKQLVKLIKESNVKFQVGYAERFNPAYTVLQSLSPKPVFIEAKNIIPVNREIQNQNLLFELMASDIDIIISIAKSEVKNISAISASVISDTDDMINARIEFNNGCVANITWGRLSISPVHQMLFYESGKFIEIDLISKKTLIIDHENLYNIKKMHADSIKADESSIYKKNNPVKLQLEEFRNAVLNNTPTIVSAIDGLRAMEIAYKILQKTKYTC